MKFYDYLKNIFLIIIVLQVLPLFFENIRKQYSKYVSPRTQVAVLSVKGVLYDSAHYNKYLAKYFKDSDIKAILLKIESPGGAAGTSAAIYSEILQLKKEYPKPIITLVENVCASGGYYVASATDYIISPGSAMIGSIGAAFPSIFQLKNFIEYYNVRNVSLKAGEYKNTGNPLVDMTPQETAMLQGVLDDSYSQFTHDIAQARHIPLDTNKEWANGKIFTARQALEHKLIDELGSAYNAIAYLKKAAAFEGEIEWVRPPAKSTFAKLFESEDDSEDDTSMFASFTDALCTSVENRFFTPRVQ